MLHVGATAIPFNFKFEFSFSMKRIRNILIITTTRIEPHSNHYWVTESAILYALVKL